MKKSLVLALVLVMALTASAFAGVTIGGEFEAKLTQEPKGAAADTKLEFGKGKFELKNTLKLTVAGSGEAERWSFSGELGDLRTSESIKLGKYELKLADELFTASIWGNEKETSDKASLLGFVTAPKKADKGKMRLRVTAPVLELANVTVDYAPAKEVYGFVEGEVAGYNVGLAVRQKYATPYAAEVKVEDTYLVEGNSDTQGSAPSDEKLAVAADTTIVGFGTIDLDVATIKLEAGIRVGDDIAKEKNYAYGVEVAAPVAEGITVNAGYKAQEKAFADKKELSAGIKYEGIVTADASVAMSGKMADFNTDTIKGSIGYSPLEILDLKLSAESVGQKAGKGLDRVRVDNRTNKISATADATLVADFITGSLTGSFISNEKGVAEFANIETAKSASAKYAELIGIDGDGADVYTKYVPAKPRHAVRLVGKTAYEAKASLTVTATEKLTLTPSVEFLKFEGGKGLDARRPNDTEKINWATEGTRTTIKNVAEYTLGEGDTVLSFELGQTTNKDFKYVEDTVGSDKKANEKEQFATFKVTVKF